MLILFLRKPDAVLNAQLWAEDGMIYLPDALLDGPRSLDPHAGYFVLVSRLIALAATRLVPLELIPLAFNASAMILTGVVIYLLLTSRIDIRPKPLFALMPILVPHSGEVFSNVTNVAWFGATVIATLIIQRAPIDWREALRRTRSSRGSSPASPVGKV